MADPLSRLTDALADRYRIEREIGAGGMATVYLAHDLKHDRRLAIKVLRSELAAAIGAERFLAEIRTTANLQHPNILPLFDSGALSTDSRLTTPDSRLLFYVMPFVDGESLRARLTREKQLPIPDAVRIATEVAGALDYAHRHGVIHRDIKPENILLHDGRALVADFGIALAATRAGGARITETGMSLGTPAYMPPEQAMGEREITGRADIYALGCVTYEMLSGEPPFSGPTAQAIIARVVTEQPRELIQQRHSIPANVQAAVLKAIEKLPADRFNTPAEFSTALNNPAYADRISSRHPDQSARHPERSEGPARLSRVVPMLAATAFVAALATWLAARHQTSASRFPPARLALITPGLGGPTQSLAGRQIAMTPAGDAIVYVGTRDHDTTALYLRRLDAPGPVEIVGSANVRNPVITPDGRAVIGTSSLGGFRLPLEGGLPQPIALSRTSLVGAWAPDGSYWFTSVGINGLTQLTPSDSAIPLAIPRDKQRGIRVQQVLSDGHTALATRAPAATGSGPAVLFDLRTGDITPLMDVPVIEVQTAVGELVAVLQSGAIVAAPFDERSHRITGTQTQVATGVSLTGTGLANFALAPNGSVAYIEEGKPSLVLVDVSGHVRHLVEGQAVHGPRFSPDGRQVSYDVITLDGRDVWVLSLDQLARSRATFAGDGHDAIWAPDGQSITYMHLINGVVGLYQLRPGSTAPPESLIASPHLDFTGTWLRDGSALISDGSELHENSGGDVVRIANAGKGPVEPLVASRFLERFAVPSPDGKWLAFTSDQSGREEVYLRSLTIDGDPVPVSQEGGTEAVWSPDGRELYYRSVHNGEGVLMAATVSTSPTLRITSQRLLFNVQDIVGTGPHANYDISPDGKNFVMVRKNPVSHIIVIQDLPGLLRQLRANSSH